MKFGFGRLGVGFVLEPSLAQASQVWALLSWSTHCPHILVHIFPHYVIKTASQSSCNIPGVLPCLSTHIHPPLICDPSKRLLAAAIHKKVNIYEIASASPDPVYMSLRHPSIHSLTKTTQLVTFEGHTLNVTSVSFHSEGKWLVTGSEDGTIKIWDLRCVGGILACFSIAIEVFILRQKLTFASNLWQLGSWYIVFYPCSRPFTELRDHFQSTTFAFTQTKVNSSRATKPVASNNGIYLRIYAPTNLWAPLLLSGPNFAFCSSIELYFA
jgi:WD40 repeat protein